MAGERLLVVNADDFGMSRSVNRGIARAHRDGIVTSASLMVRRPAATEAAVIACGCPGLGVGLHVDLGEWVCRAGSWEPRYEVVPCSEPAAVEREVTAQLEQFRSLMQRDPTHLDSHQHVHLREPVASVLRGLATELDLPLRSVTAHARYCGAFYGQTGSGEPIPGALEPASLIGLLCALPAGITELACHPGETWDLDSSYRDQREAEVATLCDPGVRSALVDQRIVLVSFAGLGRRLEAMATPSPIG